MSCNWQVTLRLGLDRESIVKSITDSLRRSRPAVLQAPGAITEPGSTVIQLDGSVVESSLWE